MGRRKRKISTPCCYHITHRCQERRFFLKFEIDRRNYCQRLFKMTQSYAVDVLDYMVTSNHIHLLLWSKHAHEISKSMHYLSGNTARDYNRRKQREGSFWRGRYHPTLIEDGTHLARCLLYIDLNMVRAGVCDHPHEWKACGYHELIGQRQRYRIINRDRLLRCLQVENDSQFSHWYLNTLEEKLCQKHRVRESIWSEAMAIGSENWIKTLTSGLLGARIIRYPPQLHDSHCQVNEPPQMYGLHISKREKEHFWKKQQNLS